MLNRAPHSRRAGVPPNVTKISREAVGCKALRSNRLAAEPSTNLDPQRRFPPGRWRRPAGRSWSAPVLRRFPSHDHDLDPSSALASAPAGQSGRGLPHSKTLRVTPVSASRETRLAANPGPPQIFVTLGVPPAAEGREAGPRVIPRGAPTWPTRWLPSGIPRGMPATDRATDVPGLAPGRIVRRTRQGPRKPVNLSRFRFCG